MVTSPFTREQLGLLRGGGTIELAEGSESPEVYVDQARPEP